MQSNDTTDRDFPQIVPIPNKNIRDLTGQSFGRVVVLGYVGSQQKKARWLCHCQCGTYFVTQRGSLVDGHTHSCGCLAKENAGKANLKHGMTGTEEWKCWTQMVARCTSPKSTGFKHWGGRGIQVCAGWRNSFASFFADVGKKPGHGHEYSIDRINVNGHYSCGHCEQCQEEGWEANCRWATLEEQYNNTRQNHYLEFQGERLTIKQWARKLHVHHDCLYWRVRAGWATEKILTTPAKHYAPVGPPHKPMN